MADPLTAGLRPADDARPPAVLLLDTALLAAVVPLAWWLAGRGGSAAPAVAVAVLLGFVAADWFPVELDVAGRTRRISFAAVPLVVGICTLPPLLVVGLRLAASLFVRAGAHRHTSSRLATVVLAHALEVAVAAAVAVLLLDGPALGPGAWAAVLVAVLAAHATGVAVAAAEATLRRHPLDLRRLGIGAGVRAVVLAPGLALGLVVVTLLETRPSAAVLGIAASAVLAGVARAYARSSARYRVLRDLDSFTTAIGGSVLDGRLHEVFLAELRDRLRADVAWMESPGTEGGRFVLGEELRHEPLPAGCEPLRAQAAVGAVQVVGDDGDAPGREVVVVVRVGDDRLLVGVARSGPQARPFDPDDLRLLDLLVSHAGVALQNVRLVDQLRTQVDTSELMATRDQLTGLPNRTLFQRRIAEALDERREERPVAVLLLGLDRFKDVNETLGHDAGDEVLAAVGRRLRSAVEAPASVARVGGDEFGVVWTGDSPEEVEMAARGVLAAVEGLYGVAAIELDVVASAGLAVAGAEAEGPEALTLLRRADVAHCRAKRERTTFEVYRAEWDTANPMRLALAGRLRTAIEARELTLHYQPQVDLHSGAVVGAEALVRWTPPGGKPVSPVELIEVAERTGLIRPLTRFVLHEAVRQAAAWAEAGTPVRVAVNLSPRDIGDDLVDHVAALLDEYQLDPMLLEVEITETTVMVDPEGSIATLARLHDLDVSISVDDFGTGHSSLSYLTRLPVDQVKIDRTFLMAMSTDESAEAVVRTIVDLGRNLGLEVVAEGVETAANVEVLRGMGCGVAQGYFYARPMPAESFAQWLAGHDPELLPVRPPLRSVRPRLGVRHPAEGSPITLR